MVWWLICVEHFDIVQFIIYLINLLHRAHKAKSIKFHTFSDTLIENRFIFLIKTMTFARESTYNNFFYKRSTCCSIQYFILICDAMRFDVAGKYDEFYHNFFFLDADFGCVQSRSFPLKFISLSHLLTLWMLRIPLHDALLIHLFIFYIYLCVGVMCLFEK